MQNCDLSIVEDLFKSCFSDHVGSHSGHASLAQTNFKLYAKKHCSWPGLVQTNSMFQIVCSKFFFSLINQLTQHGIFIMKFKWSYFAAKNSCWKTCMIETYVRSLWGHIQWEVSQWAHCGLTVSSYVWAPSQCELSVSSQWSSKVGLSSYLHWVV